MKPTDDKFAVKSLWSFSTSVRFNALVVDTLFRYPGLSVILGGEDGIVRIFDQPRNGSHDAQARKPKGCLETKSGAVQNLAVHDVTKFYQKDLIVGDAAGMLTVFCNQQILSRQSVSDHSLNCLQVQQDAMGKVAIVSSDDCGLITAHLPSGELWRLHLNDQSIMKEPGMSLCVKCLLAVELTNYQGQRSSYILASDTAQQVHVLHQGTLVHTIRAPANITAMCSGKFLPLDKLGLAQPAGENSLEKNVTQVALGAATGAVYILHHFTLSMDEFANTGLPISQMTSLSMPDVQSDLLLCAGHFNALQFFHEGKKCVHYETTDWINSLTLSDLDNDGAQEVVMGCLDNTVHAVKVSPT